MRNTHINGICAERSYIIELENFIELELNKIANCHNNLIDKIQKDFSREYEEKQNIYEVIVEVEHKLEEKIIYIFEENNK